MQKHLFVYMLIVIPGSCCCLGPTAMDQVMASTGVVGHPSWTEESKKALQDPITFVKKVCKISQQELFGNNSASFSSAIQSHYLNLVRWINQQPVPGQPYQFDASHLLGRWPSAYA